MALCTLPRQRFAEGGDKDGSAKGAGFENVSVRADTKALTLPEPADFLWQYLNCTPLAAVVAQGEAEDRNALERDVVEAWSEFQQEGDFILHVRVAIAIGEKR